MNPIMDLWLHKCTKEDLDDLVQISKSTFVAAFESLNDPDDFNHYLTTAFSPARLLEELNNPLTSFYFAYSGDTLIGYIKLNEGKAQTDIKEDGTLELERIYVIPEWQGRQIGKWMLDKAVELGRERGKKYLWLGVWEHNTAAIRFYEKNGFHSFGTHPYFIGKDKQTDWLMRLDLVS